MIEYINKSTTPLYTVNLTSKFISLQAFFLIWKTIGIRHTIAIILKFPAILLTPAFSFWIIGPYGKMHSKATSSQFIQEKFLIVSYFHSWINAAMTLAGAIITWTVVGKINQKDGEEEEIGMSIF